MENSILFFKPTLIDTILFNILCKISYKFFPNSAIFWVEGSAEKNYKKWPFEMILPFFDSNTPIIEIDANAIVSKTATLTLGLGEQYKAAQPKL